ncbi:DUF4238 domain-containing protein [Vibrio diabolicus]|uniref:DUF4238 domain-containing protein n=1 Tax=Vibrio diabolicus TaxID=50719 RepID=UPI00215E2194|nr:DUF4238 domain-containing protein [Vibrio diabolicus]MCR9567124.1 DUF4238 domain-containing protein [Vibrio alginolyticus]MCS0345360.1 DUF4238 domain-containing protein [Vibrio diabolicus]MCS0360570.1 DUF4238 domain-containing protein [Vibrio diabolicus]MCS0375871.1 DUF4238 domain-containing protein [Vibrio diabolicus]MCS0407987.1 DUF4238 domain-containing protein [Vibrio diabolicus]
MHSPLKLTTDVKKQHTVPRFLLDQFGFGKKGKKRQLFTFDKLKERVFPQSVFDATTRNTFYNIENHPERASLEPILGMYETDAAPIIKKIISEKSLSWMSDDDRYIVSAFIAVQRARSYGELQRINHVIDAFSEKLTDFGAQPSQVEIELGGNNSPARKNLFLKLVLGQDKAITHFMNKSWLLYETDMLDPFYVSDNPVTLHNDIDMGLYGNLGIALKGIQIHLPISSTLTLALTCPSIKQSALDGKNFIKNYVASNPELLSKIENPAGIIDLATAYETGKPVKVPRDNVRFLNSLQVSFSEQYVFCEKKHFDLVQEMIRNNEAYKSGPRLKIN